MGRSCRTVQRGPSCRSSLSVRIYVHAEQSHTVVRIAAFCLCFPAESMPSENAGGCVCTFPVGVSLEYSLSRQVDQASAKVQGPHRDPIFGDRTSFPAVGQEDHVFSMSFVPMGCGGAVKGRAAPAFPRVCRKTSVFSFLKPDAGYFIWWFICHCLQYKGYYGLLNENGRAYLVDSAKSHGMSMLRCWVV